ncbi:hypothetical protein NPA07_02530 [Mycoplasmopsis caviae]|uniref:Uncharacterized protein n=1 Tax=Mycoplasmopsis caviae TaxID=55603 RepID=A0ABY5J003_9BACT|nr:hypothetical protein [Mycoplasmopsis caviae]UUD35728.1 hypothetical protein NPA07_02530 [Mycoplasmopsis caviae]
MQKIFDTTEKLANELYNLRESDNFLIKSIENKDVKFDELKSAVNEYKTQKERDEFKNEKKLTKDFILTGLKLLSEDYKIWDEGVLAKLNEDKTTNSISKSLINNKDVEVLQTISGLDISKFQQAKNILTKYFTSEGKIIKYKPSLSRSHILNDLKIANDTISEYNKDIVKYSTNLITSLKKKIDTSRILEQTTLLDYSSEKNNYDKLYSAKDEIVTHSSDGNLWELEKVGNIIHKSIDLINKEKNQTASLMTFIDNSLKLKMKNFNGNIDELIEKIKFQTEWSEIKELVNKSNEDLTNVKSLEYISKRNEIINSFVSIKQHINKLKDEAVKFWKYGKQRLGAFKTSYENIKNELDVFNIFDFSYSTISDQLNENKTLLTKNVDKTFETTSDLLEFLNSLMHAKELENVDLKNFNSVKSAIATNINIKLPLAIKIDEKNNVRFKQLSELSDVSSIIQTINLKNNVINELNLAEWNNMNVDEVKKIYTQMFNNILEINLEIPKIVSIKSKYLKYVDEATNIINTYNQSIWDKKSIETIREYLSKTEVEKKVEHWRNIISSTIKNTLSIFQIWMKSP